MLVELHVANFVLIDELHLALGPGLNVLTGETGAGKSIVVAAVELLLGGRARSDVVRTGASETQVEARFDLSQLPEVRDRVAGLGLGDAAAEELVVRRAFAAGGKSRCWVNGRIASVAMLADVGTGLVDISSQHEHHTLTDPATHVRLLDGFAGLDDARDELRAHFGALGEAALALAALITDEAERSAREDLLRFQVREIEAAALRVGEEEERVRERERLRHAERLLAAARGGHEALYAADGAVSEVLGRVARDLSALETVDPDLAPLRADLEAAGASIEEVADRLRRYADRLNADPEQLAALEDRLDLIGRLRKKYGPDVAAILARRDAAQEELASLDRHDDLLRERTAARDEALHRACETARALSANRKKAAKRFAGRLSEELSTLGMGGARVVVDVSPASGGTGEFQVDGARLSATGIDRVELLIAPNRGEEARPLRRIASGGELSRAMLAVKQVLAGRGPAGTYVFDEVDAGVGGAVAEVVGKKLREVARHHQVLCITHLPQVASFADTHFRVAKREVRGRTLTEVHTLSADERLEEVARMLGGSRVTDKTRAAAAELLRGAAE